MKNSQRDSLIRAYLRKELSVSEQAHFEAQLKTDVDFQQAFIAFCLREEVSKELSMEDRLRAMADSVKDEIGPIPKPRLTWWDQLRFAMYRPLIRGLAIGASVVLSGTLLLLVLVNTGGVVPAHKVPIQYLILPPCNIHDQETAGKVSTEPLVDINDMLDRCKRFYCNAELDSLQTQRDSFGVSDNYAALLELKAQQWTAARLNLEKCLSKPEFLQNFTSLIDPAELRFNLLLARLGESGEYGQIRDDLVKLIEDPSTGQLVKKQAKALRADMESPVRWFYFR